MLDYLIAAFLGFVEGLTEFIPVSSTAHLLIIGDLIDFQGPPGHVFEVFIQLGAIMAVVVFYWQRLWTIGTTFHKDASALHFVKLLAIGTIPALIAGALGRNVIKDVLYNPSIFASALIIGGILMIILERKRLTPERYMDVDSIPLKTALIIGCCQAIALIPGVSRSGASIMGGLSAGLSRKTATEFSFFLAIPVMVAAVTFDTWKSWNEIMNGGYWGIMITGFIAAFITALIFIRVVLAIVSRIGFYPFAIYRIIIGTLVLIFIA